MRVDWHLKKLANFFKFVLCILEKSLKLIIICYFSQKSLHNFFVSQLSSFDHNTRNHRGSAPLKFGKLLFTCANKEISETSQK